MFASYIIILVSCTIVKPAKLLVVVPTPSISHQVVFRPLIQELIKHKHEVTVITTDATYSQGDQAQNLTEIDLHDLSYTLWRKVINEFSKIDQHNLTKMRVTYRWLSETFIQQLKNKSVQNLIRDKRKKFNMLIIETCVPATLIFSHIFTVPVIFMSPFGSLPGKMKMVGSEIHPLLFPTHFQQKIYNLTIWEKIFALYTDLTYDNIIKTQELEDDKILKEHFGINTPALDKLKTNVHMLFLNVHPIWLHNQPVSPNVVYTWGINNPSEKILPKKLQSYLESSKHGVIYFSFGSNFKPSAVSKETLEIFLKVFSSLPYNILWKWDADELPGKSENIIISKWFPQCDVLRHPKVKLFITHGGLQSTHEAINAGVPLIGIPQFADQGYNTEKYVYFKIGIKLDYHSLTIENFDQAIKTVLGNYESYKNNIVELRTRISDQQKPALEHVTWWIEYVLRHGGVRHLRAPAANMSWAQYYELEIVFLVLSVLILIGTVLLAIMYTCLRSILHIVKMRIK